MTWRCRVCGHKTAADEQPASCPHCGQPGTELSAEDPRPEPRPPDFPSERLQPRIRMPRRGEHERNAPQPGRKRTEEPGKPIRWA